MGNGRSCGKSLEPYDTDEACLTFFTQDNGSFNIFSQSTECEGCDLIQIQVNMNLNFIFCLKKINVMVWMCLTLDFNH
jgi:hypothetical protein